MWIEASTPLTIRRQAGDVRLLPGQPVDFPETEALKLLARAHGKVREATGGVDLREERKQRQTTQALAPGDRITWTRGDLTVQQGIVDVVHRDTDGQAWAFCTVPGGSWTAVNVKFVKGSHR